LPTAPAAGSSIAIGRVPTLLAEVRAGQVLREWWAARRRAGEHRWQRDRNVVQHIRARQPMPLRQATSALEGTFRHRRRLRGSCFARSSLTLIFMVLYSRYRSALLAGLIMANVPLALVGSVLGLWLSGQPLSVAALIGFITLAGIATRNGILKVSHYLNLAPRARPSGFGAR
jgi:hypothetical protein